MTHREFPASLVRDGTTPTVRYISRPSEEDVEVVRRWIRDNHEEFEDPFDCSVGCSYDLQIFDLDEHIVDPRQDRPIAHWIGKLVESFYSGDWK